MMPSGSSDTDGTLFWLTLPQVLRCFHGCHRKKDYQMTTEPVR